MTERRKCPQNTGHFEHRFNLVLYLFVLGLPHILSVVRSSVRIIFRALCRVGKFSSKLPSYFPAFSLINHAVLRMNPNNSIYIQISLYISYRGDEREPNILDRTQVFQSIRNIFLTHCLVTQKRTNAMSQSRKPRNTNCSLEGKV